MADETILYSLTLGASYDDLYRATVAGKSVYAVFDFDETLEPIAEAFQMYGSHLSRLISLSAVVDPEGVMPSTFEATFLMGNQTIYFSSDDETAEMKTEPMGGEIPK